MVISKMGDLSEIGKGQILVPS